jgi:hypothetical protein
MHAQPDGGQGTVQVARVNARAQRALGRLLGANPCAGEQVRDTRTAL